MIPVALPGPPLDGRQSPAALAIRRGAVRALMALDLCAAAEVTLASGRRADLVALARDGEIWILEIKSSIADFRADAKWPDYRAYCDRFFFAVDPGFPISILPTDAGLLLADAHGGWIEREAPAHPLAPARRKAVTLALARTLARRLGALEDPEGILHMLRE